MPPLLLLDPADVADEQAEMPSRSHPHADPSRTWLWPLALAALTLLFFLSFFNRFAGLRSGTGEFTTGLWFLHGHLPYRDYFSATPPLNTLKSALLLKLFGPFLIVGRAAGVVERVAIALVLFTWLRRLFPIRFAFTASIVTIILSAGDRTDPIASYNHDAIFLAMLSGLAASHVLTSKNTRDLLLWSSASGLFAGLCMLTKQTIGLGAMVAVPVTVVILLLNARLWRGAFQWIVSFALGCAIPLLLLSAWLARMGMLHTFFTMVFLKGPAAKGGHPGAFLAREWMVAESNWFFVALALIGIGFAARAILRSQSDATANEEPSAAVARLRSITLGFGLVILAAQLLAYTHFRVFYNFSKAAVYFVFFLVALQFLGYAALAVRRPLTPRQQQFALFATVSFFIAFFLSLSWPAFEAMLLPGLGLLVAAALHGAEPRSRRRVYAVLGLFVFLQVREKLAMPFSFDGLSEPSVKLATDASTLPELRGLRLAPSTNRFLEGAAAVVAQHSTPADTILTYPEMSLFYPLTDRGYPTLAASHNVDVVNDTFAAEEASRILARRPAVVIFLPLTDGEVLHEDQIWRFGRPSGQHLLVDAVHQLTARYTLAATYNVGQELRPIQVYTRP